jgi:hypothetical protein
VCPDSDDCDYPPFYEKLNLGFKPADTKNELIHLRRIKPKNLINSPGQMAAFLRINKFNLDIDTINNFLKALYLLKMQF